MTKNPFLNALIAIIYISLIACFFNFGQRFLGAMPDSVIQPIVMLSLLVLSAALMGLTFFYQPVVMYLDGNKKESLSLLSKTIGIFACAVVILIITLFILAAQM